MTFMEMFISLLILAIYSTPQKSLDLTTLVSKSEQQVESVLGKVENVEKYTPPGQKCECLRHLYRNGQIRIIYKEGKADRIYISYDINIVNLEKAKITSLHRWKNEIEIRATQIASCCAATSKLSTVVDPSTLNVKAIAY